MAKIKPFTGKKYCTVGEMYIFRKGVAIVPGMLFSQKQVKISLMEFIKLNKKEQDDP